MSTFDTLAAFKSQLQRKALVGAVFVAPYSTAALTTISTTGGELGALTGHTSIGKLTADGISLPNDVERQEMRGWGDTASPSRIDIVSENSSMNFTAMESSRAVLDAFHNVDLSTVTADLNGEVSYDKPPVPELRDMRVLALVRDINKANGLDVYMGVYFPKANISQNGEQTLANTEAGLAYPMTAQALVDDVEGTAVRVFWTGPGLAALKTDMGWA